MQTCCPVFPSMPEVMNYKLQSTLRCSCPILFSGSWCPKKKRLFMLDDAPTEGLRFWSVFFMLFDWQYNLNILQMFLPNLHPWVCAMCDSCPHFPLRFTEHGWLHVPLWVFVSVSALFLGGWKDTAEGETADLPMPCTNNSAASCISRK